MGLFSAISAWNASRYAKHVSNMEEKGLCPDCRGKGFNAYAPNEYYYSHVYDCSGCNGSGSFSDWAETNAEL
ncbi:methionine aminopeptidase [Peribacillus glennii]|uniref:Methionine aminopeptidase n=1 Tax=Peribacillus glennii TaxID=2303991 RepID=A0A372L8S0_9BACI|nr:methionine aminopeptidase [Peribacillus glennii]RFU61818.1 methionine aminopeptidase [Peribacillus glennii]